MKKVSIALLLFTRSNYYLRYLPATNWALTLNFKHNNDRNNGPFPLVIGDDDAFKDPIRLNQNALTTIIDNTAQAG